MTLSELIAEIKRYGFGDGTGHSDSTITTLINTAISEVLAEANWPFTEASSSVTLVQNATTVDTPSDFSKTKSLFLAPYDTNTGLDTGPVKKLVYLPSQDFIELNTPNVSQGTPQYYTVLKAGLLNANPADQIAIHPKPNGAYRGTFWYMRQAPELSGGSNKPFIPNRYHYILVDRVLSRLYHSTDQPDQGKLAEERYAARLEQMKIDLLDVSLDRRDALSSGYAVGSIIKEVRDHGFDRAGDALIKVWINDVLHELSGMDNWPWLEKGPVTLTVNAGDGIVTLPSDCAKPIKLQLPSQNMNVFRERHDLLLDKYSTDVTEESGTPERYAMWSTTDAGVPRIRLFPTPERQYTFNLWYQKVPEALTTIDQLPPFPARHHRILVLGVLIRAAQMMGDEQSLAKLPIFQDDFEKRLERMRNDLLRAQLDNNDYVPMDGDPESPF